MTAATGFRARRRARREGQARRRLYFSGEQREEIRTLCRAVLDAHTDLAEYSRIIDLRERLFPLGTVQRGR